MLAGDLRCGEPGLVAVDSGGLFELNGEVAAGRAAMVVAELSQQPQRPASIEMVSGPLQGWVG